MKRTVCFILTLLILTLCACKGEEPNLSTADTLTNADISIIPDDEKDPENYNTYLLRAEKVVPGYYD